MTVERTLDPTISATLAELPVMIGELNEEMLPVIRSQRLTALGAVELSDEVERVDRTVPGPPGGPDVLVRTYRPKGVSGPLPCVYSIHGGGYVIGTYEMEDLRFDQWCTRLGVMGVSVEYRLAPETPYPGPLEDCYAGLRWVFDNA